MDISQITDYLYVGALPCAADAEPLSALNVRLIISMCAGMRPADPLTQPPFKLLWLPTYDTPFAPIPMDKLAQGVQAALPVIRAGGRVFTHCVAGRHRSVAMGAAILIGMGHSAREATQMLRDRRKSADPQAWYIQWRIRKFEQHWNRL